jgi:hypothetical protein
LLRVGERRNEDREADDEHTESARHDAGTIARQAGLAPVVP